MDDEYDVAVDYMVGIRRYMPGESDANKYRYYIMDHLGSVVMMTGHNQGMEYYNYLKKNVLHSSVRL